MSKFTTFITFLLVPVFIVLIVIAVKDLMDYKTGYSFDIKEMEMHWPSLTFCPTFHGGKTLSPEEALSVLGNGSTLPINVKLFAMGWSMDIEYRYSIF